jgi:FkbM family methyltransferase
MKGVVKKILYNRTLPVLSSSLRGVKLRVNDLIQGSVFINEYEPDKHKAFQFLIKNDDTFFDVGANIGLHTYFVARKFPSVKIFAFEPLPGNAEYIREAIRVNGFTNIHVNEAAVSAAPGELYFDKGKNNFMGFLTTEKTDLTVKLISLDEYTSTNNIYPDVLKIDVEGFEGEVLKGSVQLIGRCKPTFIIELHNPVQDVEVSVMLRKHGYFIFRLNPDAKEVSAGILLPIKNPDSPFPDPDGVWGNIIAIHSTKMNNYNL